MQDKSLFAFSSQILKKKEFQKFDFSLDLCFLSSPSPSIEIFFWVLFYHFYIAVSSVPVVLVVLKEPKKSGTEIHQMPITWNKWPIFCIWTFTIIIYSIHRQKLSNPIAEQKAGGIFMGSTAILIMLYWYVYVGNYNTSNFYIEIIRGELEMNSRFGYLKKAFQFLI